MGHGARSGGVLPVDVEQARVLTAQIRAAIAEVMRSGAVLADRVRQAHEGRIWTVLGYASWGAYASAELGVSRAQAYRLVEMARTTDRLAAAAAGLQLSPMGDIGLSGRALRAIRDRVDEVAVLLAERVDAAGAAGRDLTGEQAAALVRQAVEEVRRQPPPAALPPAPVDDLEALSGRELVERLRVLTAEFGAITLEIAPAYVSEEQAAEWLAPFADEVGEALERVLAARRYAATGDLRSLQGEYL